MIAAALRGDCQGKPLCGGGGEQGEVTLRHRKKGRVISRQGYAWEVRGTAELSAARWSLGVGVSETSFRRRRLARGLWAGCDTVQ